MRVTKFVHSCLLVEEGGFNVLIDPGKFSWDSRLLNLSKLPHLSHIVITHDHPDHYHETALRALAMHFPHARIVTNNDLALVIKDLGLPNTIVSGSEKGMGVFEAPHVPLPMRLPAPLNIGVHIADKLTHPGDAFNFKHTREILALPITAPFASFKQALEAAVKLKPKIVLPVHDWEWHRVAREARYAFAKELLGPKNIEFIELENSEPVEF